MRRLERGNDSFQSAEQPKPVQRLGIGHGDVGGAAAVLEKGMLRPDAGIVEARGDRVRRMNLAGLVLEEIAQRSVEHARRPARQ